MEAVPKHKTLLSKLFAGSGWALFTMFVWELVEEGIENIIALVLSSAVALLAVKALSTLAIITTTQGIKVAIKRFLLPFIKKLTYKEGNDKMSKIKSFFVWLWCNKKTLTGTASSAVMTLSGTGVIDISTLPILNIDGLNVTPIIYYGCLAILSIVGMFGKGLENIKEFFERVGFLKEKKTENAILKEAGKELKKEQKLANQTQAEQEKAKLKAEQDARIKAENEKLEAEKKAKIEEAKQRLIQQQVKTE